MGRKPLNGSDRIVQVRVLGANDAVLFASVAPDVFDAPIDPRLAAEVLRDPRHHVVVALDGGVVVGMATGVHYVHPDKPAELFINEVGVAPSHQRRGIARKLLDALLAHARGIGCREAWVLTEPDNHAAQALYRATGGGAGTEVVMFSYPLDDATTHSPEEG